METCNDLNSAIVNFFRMLRIKPAELVEQIRLTPWVRAEYENAFDENANESAIELARRLYYRLTMSFSGQYHSHRSSWRRFNKGTKKIAPGLFSRKPHRRFRTSFVGPD
jgi:DNA adenine methylase